MISTSKNYMSHIFYAHTSHIGAMFAQPSPLRVCALCEQTLSHTGASSSSSSQLGAFEVGNGGGRGSGNTTPRDVICLHCVNNWDCHVKLHYACDAHTGCSRSDPVGSMGVGEKTRHSQKCAILIRPKFPFSMRVRMR